MAFIMDITDIFKEKKIKKTTPRVAIVSALLNTDIPLSESEIKDRMGSMYDRSTFYRSIQTLLDFEIIHRIMIDNTTVKYALNNFENKCVTQNHVHFFCRVCHSVSCLKNITIPKISLPQNYEEEECETLIRGVCGDCNRSATISENETVNA